MANLWSYCDSKFVRWYHSYLHGHVNYNFLLMIMWYNYTSTNYAVFLCFSVLVISVTIILCFRYFSWDFPACRVLIVLLVSS